jgi:tetrapyrrole methylase family protein/MazG family protein
LRRLDRIVPGHLTAVYVPPLASERRPPRFDDLVEVMRRLRGDGGCPWDRAQTHASLRKWLIEECYEVVEAIDQGDMGALCEELGDVLLQIAFHAQIASESGVFDADDVIASIVRKLVNRHPHVFGAASAADPAEVERNWEAIKKTEKEGRDSVLDGVPASLPALHRAAELGRRAAAAGFDWERVDDVLAKIEEELRELRAGLASGRPDEVRHEIGDLLFAVTNLARWAGVEPEEALREMLARFAARFRRIEQAAAEGGRDLRDLTLAEMDDIWNRAKAEGV